MLDPNTRKFIALHSHRFGTDIHLFQSEYNAVEMFIRLSTGQQIEFAEALGIDYEPDREETLEVVFATDESFEDADLSAFVVVLE